MCIIRAPFVYVYTIHDEIQYVPGIIPLHCEPRATLYNAACWTLTLAIQILEPGFLSRPENYLPVRKTEAHTNFVTLCLQLLSSSQNRQSSWRLPHFFLRAEMLFSGKAWCPSCDGKCSVFLMLVATLGWIPTRMRCESYTPMHAKGSDETGYLVVIGGLA
jgi:hypothetical protein